jgi:hypothetical protein
MNEHGTNRPFSIKDCALAEIATGKRAQNLRELRDCLIGIDAGCIYYHFWGGLLRPRFVEPEYNNDFAAWASHALHDGPLAERLGVIDPTGFKDLDDLRRELIEVIEERLDESDWVPWAKRDQQFYFMRSQIVVFDTHQQIVDPRDLARVAPRLSLGSVFYHFIDARRRDPIGADDFRAWLADFDGQYKELCNRLAAIEPYFDSLAELRKHLARAFREFFGEDAS